MSYVVPAGSSLDCSQLLVLYHEIMEENCWGKFCWTLPFINARTSQEEESFVQYFSEISALLVYLLCEIIQKANDNVSEFDPHFFEIWEVIQIYSRFVAYWSKVSVFWGILCESNTSLVPRYHTVPQK